MKNAGDVFAKVCVVIALVGTAFGLLVFGNSSSSYSSSAGLTIIIVSVIFGVISGLLGRVFAQIISLLQEIRDKD